MKKLLFALILSASLALAQGPTPNGGPGPGPIPPQGNTLTTRGAGVPSGTPQFYSQYVNSSNGDHYGWGLGNAWIKISGGTGSGTVTSVTGTAGQISVATGTDTPAISIANPFTFPGPVTAGSVNGVIVVDGSATYPRTTAGIQAAVTAAPEGGSVFLPTGTYDLTSNLPIVVTKALDIYGAGWGTSLVVGAGVGATTDIFLVQPSTNLNKGKIRDLEIVPASGTPARRAISFDATNGPIAYFLIDHVWLGQLGGEGIYCSGSGDAQGCLVQSSIQNSVIFGGTNLTNAGDTVRIINNQILGAGLAVDVSFQPGSSTFILRGNNITSDGGVHIGTYAYGLLITENEFETKASFTGSHGSVLDIDATTGSHSISGEITTNSFQVVSGITAHSIRVNYADGLNIHGNTSERGATTSKDILITSNATSTNTSLNTCYVGGLVTCLIDDSGTNTSTITQDSGNIGIGTTGPNKPLTVVGNGVASTVSVLGTGASGNGVGILFNNTYGGPNKFWSIGVDNAYGKGLNFGEPGVADGQIFIKPGGDVGISTTAPGYRLDVQGGQINASGGLCIATDCKTVWPTFSGTGTVTSSGTPLIHQLPIWTSSTDAKGLAVPASGTLLTGIAASDPAFSATPTLGVQATTAGSITVAGTSGTSGSVVLNGGTSGAATVTASATGVLALSSGATATNMALTTPSITAQSPDCHAACSPTAGQLSNAIVANCYTSTCQANSAVAITGPTVALGMAFILQLGAAEGASATWTYTSNTANIYLDDSVTAKTNIIFGNSTVIGSAVSCYSFQGASSAVLLKCTILAPSAGTGITTS